MIQLPTDVRDPMFLAKLTLYSEQQKQDEANKKVHDEWQNTASNWLVRNQQNDALKLAIGPPLELPVMTIWHDDGTVEHPFFPDLKVPVLAPPAVVVPAHGIAADNPPPDRTDAILMLLLPMTRDIAAIKAKLGIA